MKIIPETGWLSSLILKVMTNCCISYKNVDFEFWNCWNRLPESRIRTLISNRAPILLVSQPDLAASARSAFIAYLRDYCFTPKPPKLQHPPAVGDKRPADLSAVFQPVLLPIPQFATSLGVSGNPFPNISTACLELILNLLYCDCIASVAYQITLFCEYSHL